MERTQTLHATEHATIVPADAPQLPALARANDIPRAARISTLAAAQNTALRIGVLFYPFNPATAGQELLHGFGFYRLLGALSRH